MSRFAVGEFSAEELWRARKGNPDHPVIVFLRALARERAKTDEERDEDWGSIIVVMVDQHLNYEARGRIERALAEPDPIAREHANPWLRDSALARLEELPAIIEMARGGKGDWLASLESLVSE